MNFATLIFWVIFVAPLMGVLFWIIRQDKRRSKTGYIILGVLLVGVIVYMYLNHMFSPESMMSK